MANKVKGKQDQQIEEDHPIGHCKTNYSTITQKAASQSTHKSG
ncbi:TPA: hypothetical protein ACGOV8_001180 [Streptococcus suis]